MSDRNSAYGDAIYDTWMMGGNPDLVDRDRLQDHMEHGAMDWDEAVEMEVSRCMPHPPQDHREEEAGG